MPAVEHNKLKRRVLVCARLIIQLDSSLADEIGCGPVGDRPACRAVLAVRNVLDRLGQVDEIAMRL
jgi:hypothetical protein